MADSAQSRITWESLSEGCTIRLVAGLLVRDLISLTVIGRPALNGVSTISRAGSGQYKRTKPDGDTCTLTHCSQLLTRAADPVLSGSCHCHCLP